MKQLYSKLINEHKKLKTKEAAFNDQKKIVEGLKAEMLTEMEHIGTSTYNGNKGTISIAQYEVPIVDNWEQVYRYIKQYNAFDLLQRRITSAAWRDRLDEGEKIKGIQPMTQNRLRINAK
jgi:hypothetical protein